MMTESSEEQKLKEARMISYEERSQLFLQKSTINTAKRGTRGTFCFGANAERQRSVIRE